ncbi:uncharacterized protein batf2 [Stigmatopora nigra]
MESSEETPSVSEGAGYDDGDGGEPRRRQKNRAAARKSRKKQTQKADQLHQELVNLEKSNSALEKEIRQLKKKLRSYTFILENHEPHCLLSQPVDPQLTHTPATSNPDSNPELNHSTLAFGLNSLDPHSLFLQNHNVESPLWGSSLPQPEEFPSFDLGEFLESEQVDGNRVSSPDLDVTSLSEFLEANEWILSGVGDSHVS